MYRGGTILLDICTGKVWAFHRVSLSSHDTIRSKMIFEDDCHTRGVSVQAIKVIMVLTILPSSLASWTRKDNASNSVVSVPITRTALPNAPSRPLWSVLAL
jgi:hypothetical protein